MTFLLSLRFMNGCDKKVPSRINVVNHQVIMRVLNTIHPKLKLIVCSKQ